MKRLLIVLLMSALLLIGCGETVVKSDGGGGGTSNSTEESKEQTENDDQDEEDPQEVDVDEDTDSSEGNRVVVSFSQKKVFISDKELEYDAGDMKALEDALNEALVDVDKVVLLKKQSDSKVFNKVEEVLQDLDIDYEIEGAND